MKKSSRWERSRGSEPQIIVKLFGGQDTKRNVVLSQFPDWAFTLGFYLQIFVLWV